MTRSRLEEEPDEPDEEPEAAPRAAVPIVAGEAHAYEYSVQHVSLAEIAEGTPLAARLNQASADGWDLVSIVDGGDRKAILLRRRRRPSREARLVGFAPPG